MELTPRLPPAVFRCCMSVFSVQYSVFSRSSRTGGVDWWWRLMLLLLVFGAYSPKVCNYVLLLRCTKVGVPQCIIYDWERQNVPFYVFDLIGVMHTVGKPLISAFQWYVTLGGSVAGRVELLQMCGAFTHTVQVVCCEHVLEKTMFKLF